VAESFNTFLNKILQAVTILGGEKNILPTIAP